MTNWISVKDRLPEHGVIVLITDGEDVNAGSLCFSGKYPFKFIQDDVSCEFTDFSESFNENAYIPNIVTHWMPLPEPPSEPTITQNDDCCGRCDNINDFCIGLDEDYQP